MMCARRSARVFAAAWLSASLIAVGSSAQEPAPRVDVIDPPARSGAMGAELSERGGSVVLSWLEELEAGFALRYSRLDGLEWSEPVTVVEGDKFFANWADFPSVTEGAEGAMVAHWLERSGSGTYAYGVRVAEAVDGGRWREIGWLHDDTSETEHGFVSLVAGREGVEAIWLDGRAMASGGSMSLRTRVLGGDEVVLDDDVCTCCQTDLVETDDGLVAVYRDHGDDEVRDISLVRRVSGEWSKPEVVHADAWRIPGCPVNGPAVDYLAGHLAVAWFTAAKDYARVLVAFSDDGGSQFGPPIEVDVAEPIGRVGVVAVPGGAVVSWLASGGDAARVCVRFVGHSGAAGTEFEIARTSSARSAGFPRMVRAGSALVLVWRDTSEPRGLRAARVPLSLILD